MTSPTLPPRWRLVLRDLSRDGVRTALAVLSMAVSVMSIGMVSGASVILVSTLDAAYTRNQVADAVLQITPINAALLRSVRTTPGVADAEGRRMVSARLREPTGGWRNLQLIAVPDYADVRMNRFFPQAGAWPPPDQGLLLERSSLSFLKGRLGDVLDVEMPDGRRASLPVAGTVHDINYPSAVASGLLHGYVTGGTLEALGQGGGYTELAIRVGGDAHDRASTSRVVNAVRTTIEGGGGRVLAATLPTPGRFWADDQIGATVLLLDVLAVLAFVMSGFLVANIVTALVTRQVRTIGVMKAIGATPRQVATLYMGLVLLYGVLALVVGVPAGAVGSVGIVQSTQAILNFDAPGFIFSPQILGLQVVAAVLVAVVAALRPVLKASRITVREAINPEGERPRVGWVPRGWQSLARLAGTPIRLSVRNAFRRRGRLALTLVALVLSGLAFVSVLSVRSSLDRTMAEAAASRGYDVQLTLSAPHPRAEVERLAAAAPGAVSVESWALAGAFRVRPDGSTGDTLRLVAPPLGSRLLRPPLLAGRWLQPGDRRAVVVNSDVVHDEPDIAAGRDVVLRFGGQDTTWRVVGVARGLLAGPVVYADRAEVEDLLGSAGLADNVEVIGRDRSAAGEASLARVLEERYKSAGVSVDTVDTTVQWRDVLAADYGIATNFLLGMAIVLAVVGGLTLMGTLSISVIERTREIGVMRAIGASDGAIRGLIVGEGMVIAALGWLVAAPLSPLGGRALSDAFGQAFLHVPLSFAFAWPALGLWFAVVILVAAVSSLLPAWNASRLTVRQVLAYA